MNSSEIKNAFLRRELINSESADFNLEELACSLSLLRESDQLNIIPSLMIYILGNKFHIYGLNYAEMLVFRLMPQPSGWGNLIDHMDEGEISATLKWLEEIGDYSFVENCQDELRLTIQFFREHCHPRRLN